MSIFGGSERFPMEQARSPGPIYVKPDVRTNAQVVMKADYKPVDESRKWGKREGWIGGTQSAQMFVATKESVRAPGYYNENINLIKVRAPKVSFSKSDRFLSQKVNMTDMEHQRERLTTESPGPKYNVGSLASKGGKAAPPMISFAAPPSPQSAARAELHKTHVLNVDSPRPGLRESWLSAINRNGVLLMPSVSARPRQPTSKSPAMPEQGDTTLSEDIVPCPFNNNAKGKDSGNAFGHEHRFGSRHLELPAQHNRAASNTRVQFVSATHTRENMGEFSPGPIYAPFLPQCPGGRVAPSPKSARRPPLPESFADIKDPHANLSSRSSWLIGAVRKSNGQETVLMRTGDVSPGPGSYAAPLSSFTTFSHNAKTRVRAIHSSALVPQRSPRQSGPMSARTLRQPSTPCKSIATTRSAEPTWIDNNS